MDKQLHHGADDDSQVWVTLSFGVCFRAYVHQYAKFGIMEEDFLDSFTSLEQIISSYGQLG